MSKPFDGLIIVASGTHKGYTQTSFERLVKQNGGRFSKTVDDSTTHLITNDAEIAKQSIKVKQAIERKIHIVGLGWLMVSLEKGSLQPESDFAIVANDATVVGTKSPADPSPQPDSKDVVDASDATVAGAKRPADRSPQPDSMDVVMVDAEDADPEPAVKKSKVVDGTARPKRTRAVKKEDDKVEVKPTTTASAKGKGKAVKDENEEEEEKVVMKTVIKKGKAPVDELCSLQKTHHVYVDDNGDAWDATLNQTNISGNNNKFYYIQLLEKDDYSSTGYAVFCHWGRVGETGSSQFKAQGVALGVATAQFNKVMKSKSGKFWHDRENAIGGNTKYAYLERNYEDDDEKDESAAAKTEKEEEPIAEPLISKPLQDLMKLIFNTALMQQSMESLSYDSKKMPLGKLSKTTILRGYEILKMIAEVITDPATAPAKYNEYGYNTREILSQLSSRYYTLIPHSFGRYTPPSIDTPQTLKRETELVENLIDMKISNEIIQKSITNTSNVNPIDLQYQSLGLNEAVALDKKSSEFKHLSAYVKKTHGKTHHMTLNVQEIFRVTRSVEEERWEAAGWDKFASDNRKLLWHGSRTTNYGGILSQGLRIAPPEAPVSGYMFDKGIYLADIVSKSANYCCASSSKNTGLLLLCEAQLGDPMLELTQSDYQAAKKCKSGGHLATKGIGMTAPADWEDASVVNKNLGGVSMPKVSGNETNITKDINPSGAYLQYNEYIVYDVSQVKIRYLFRCSFG